MGDGGGGGDGMVLIMVLQRWHGRGWDVITPGIASIPNKGIPQRYTGIPASLLARGDEITNNKQPKRNIYKAGIEGDYINNTQTVILISTNIQEKKK